MFPLIKDCYFAGPVFPCINAVDSDVGNTMNVSCPVCNELVYEQITCVRDHVFHNWGNQAMWFSKILRMEVHRCGELQDWNIEELERSLVV